MGWKKVKEHYQISHIVHVDGDSICIRSNMQPALIVIGTGGEFKQRYTDSKFEELLRIQRVSWVKPHPP